MVCGDLWWSVVVCGGLWYLDSPIDVVCYVAEEVIGTSEQILDVIAYDHVNLFECWVIFHASSVIY